MGFLDEIQCVSVTQIHSYKVCFKQFIIHKVWSTTPPACMWVCVRVYVLP